MGEDHARSARFAAASACPAGPALPEGDRLFRRLENRAGPGRVCPFAATARLPATISPHRYRSGHISMHWTRDEFGQFLDGRSGGDADWQELHVAGHVVPVVKPGAD